MFQALLNKLQDGSVGTGNNGVIAGVLATVGELSRVVCDYFFIGFWLVALVVFSHGIILCLLLATVKSSEAFKL